MGKTLLSQDKQLSDACLGLLRDAAVIQRLSSVCPLLSSQLLSSNHLAFLL